MYKPTSEYEIKRRYRRYVFKWFGRKELDAKNHHRRDRDTIQKGNGRGYAASIGQSPPAFAEAPASDRLETDQRYSVSFTETARPLDISTSGVAQILRPSGRL